MVRFHGAYTEAVCVEVLQEVVKELLVTQANLFMVPRGLPPQLSHLKREEKRRILDV